MDGLLLLIMGTGFLKPNISKMINELYDAKDNVHDPNIFNVLYRD
ncbi:MAG: hypothetical protein LBV42_00015 [Methanobrevibacter sp.]|nr:hypothetical protein [Methanobrevibacter sp.]